MGLETMSVKDAAAAVSLYSPKFFNRIAFDFEFSEGFDEYSDACEVLANHAVRFFDETPVDKEWIMKVIPPRHCKDANQASCTQVYEDAGYSLPVGGVLVGEKIGFEWMICGNGLLECYVGGQLVFWTNMTRGQFRAQAFAVGIQLVEDL